MDLKLADRLNLERHWSVGRSFLDRPMGRGYYPILRRGQDPASFIYRGILYKTSLTEDGFQEAVCRQPAR